MTKYQKWYLIGLYLSVNVYLTFFLIHKKEKYLIKRIFFIWLIPILGYLIISFQIIKKDFWNKIINFMLIIFVYSLIFVFIPSIWG